MEQKKKYNPNKTPALKRANYGKPETFTMHPGAMTAWIRIDDHRVLNIFKNLSSETVTVSLHDYRKYDQDGLLATIDSMTFPADVWEGEKPAS